MSSNPIRQIHQIFARRWITTDAAVDSCSWVHDHDYTGVEAGHYDVSFSYKTAESDPLHRGQFHCSGNRQVAPYHAGERISLRYNSKNPARFHLVGASRDHEKLETILVMALFALIAGYLLFAY